MVSKPTNPSSFLKKEKKKKRPHLSIKCVDPSKQRMESMLEIVNRILDITKDMSKSIARMQDSWDQMIEVLDKQSNVLLEIKEQSKDQGSHEISENQSDVLQASPTIQESNMLEGALSTKIEFEDQRFNEVENVDQRDIFMNSNESISIPDIEFVIPDEFNGVKKQDIFVSSAHKNG